MSEDLVSLTRLIGENVSAVEDDVEKLARVLRRHHHDAIGRAVEDVADDLRVRRWREILVNLDGRQDDHSGDQSFAVADAWRLFVYHPGAVTGLLFESKPMSELGILLPKRQVLADIYEAWYGLAADNAVPGVDRRSTTLGAGFLARTRWLLLSAPFRRKEAVGSISKSTIERARQAREEWLAVLDTIDDYPNLRARIDVEREAVYIASIELANDRSGADPARVHLAEHIVTRLLLPRFAWVSALRVLTKVRGRGILVHLASAGSLFFAAGVLFVLAALDVWSWGYSAAAIVALIGYCVVAIAAAARSHLGWLWLLRQPAGASVGLLALIALPPLWATAETGPATLAGGLMALIGVGYLAVEAGNHGARRVVLRAIGTGLFGLFQAAMVSLIGLRLLFPVFVSSSTEENAPFSCWWTGCAGDVLPPWLLLFTATTWSFVVGVFLQITWNDQPITAPLAHVSWRRGR